MICSPGKKELMKIDHNKIVYQPFRKNFWVEVPELKAMSASDVEAYRAVSHLHTGCSVGRSVCVWGGGGRGLSCIIV